MSQDKSVLIGALLAKIESPYGTWAAPAAGTDQIWIAEPAVFTRRWLYDGARDPQIGAIGPYTRVTPSGPYWEGTVRIRPRGNNTTYTASVFPLDSHVFLRSSAHDSAFTATKHTYTPTPGPAAFTGISIEGYARGEKIQIKGCYGDFNIIGDGLGIPMFEFPVMAFEHATPSDAQPPAITYNTTAIPQKATGMTLNIGSYLVGKIKRFEFNKQHNRTVRSSMIVAGGVVGFAYERFDPRLKVTLESTALVSTPFHTTAGLDPFKLQELATGLTIAVQVGTAAQDRFQLNATNAQLVEATPGEDGPVATWELEFQLNPSTPTALDHYNLVFGA